MSDRAASKGRESSATTSVRWWLPRDLAPEHRLHCELGPIELDVYRRASEWQLAWSRVPESEAQTHVELVTAPGPSDATAFERYVFGTTSPTVRLRPRLLDRPIVVRPRQPVYLARDAQTTLYLSSPLCLAIEVGDPPELLHELQSVRLSDTWFGPSTLEGDLCYSGVTGARARIEDLPRRPHRAITPLRIRNRAESRLPLEKLSLPVPALSLYGGEDGALWTEQILLERTSDSDFAALRVDKRAPAEARAAELLGEPRNPTQRSGLVRAFSLLFGD